MQCMPKPRHNVSFICTRFVAGGLRKIFRTVRICLLKDIKKKNNSMVLPTYAAEEILHFSFCTIHFNFLLSSMVQEVNELKKICAGIKICASACASIFVGYTLTCVEYLCIKARVQKSDTRRLQFVCNAAIISATNVPKHTKLVLFSHYSNKSAQNLQISHLIYLILVVLIYTPFLIKSA